MAPRSSRSDLEHWLLVMRTPGLGLSGVNRLIDRFGDPRAILAASPSELARLGVESSAASFLRSPDWATTKPDLEWLDHPARSVVTLLDASYPDRLRELRDPPALLFVEGDVEVLSRPQLAIVGSRNPSPTGAETAFAFAKALAGVGLTITSGLASGIDAASHRGAIAADGFTIAVTGCGAGVVYPAQNRSLSQEIPLRGAVVTEYPTGVPPRPENFPRRNRIIAGLSHGVLVVEAALRSGSLITARIALEHGREVFAIPGSIHNPMARGCHALIRQGAKLVETAEDVLEEIGPQLELQSRHAGGIPTGSALEDEPVGEALDEDYTRLLDCLGYEPTPIDRLVRRTGLTAGAVSSMLLQLELKGFVSPASGGRYVRLPRTQK